MNFKREAIAAFSTKTRRDRRRALLTILEQITAIRNDEEQYMINVPESLRCTESYALAENAVSVLDDIIDMIGDVY